MKILKIMKILLRILSILSVGITSAVLYNFYNVSPFTAFIIAIVPSMINFASGIQEGIEIVKEHLLGKLKENK